ncbi:NAD(P)H-dependent oxidoreductase [Lactiplantibacillus plantarum]|uniref:NADPH-dependent FMN reductase n=1 Tax=Lactiplantibacillus TaxID=2767842 RepID=UPI0014852260|nr:MULTISPECIES: NADPH-dependent FMN reductase [Lactiplantibacillus]MBO2723409.1 NAD(P)H-dependent oxidoreductase [Lactiplantibacillus plantarum]
MKLVAIVGTNSQKSYIRQLLNYLKTHFSSDADITLCEINDIPLFSEDISEVPSKVSAISEIITASDGVIIGTPQVHHAIPSALSSVLDWLAVAGHPFKNKPTMLIGASLDDQGVDDALDNLSAILRSPELNAGLLTGDQFVLTNVAAAFNGDELADPLAVKWLDHCFNKFTGYMGFNYVPTGDAQPDATTSASKDTTPDYSSDLDHPVKTDATASASKKPAGGLDYYSDLDASTQPTTDTTTGASKHTDATSSASKDTASDYSSDLDYPAQAADATTGASKQPADGMAYSSDLDTPVAAGTDATSGASEKLADATTGASQKSDDVPTYSSDLDDPKPETDTNTGASEHDDATTGASKETTSDYSSDLDQPAAADATTGASEH